MIKKLLAIGIIVLFLSSNISLTIAGIKVKTLSADDKDKVIYVNKLNIFGPWDGSKRHPFKTIYDGINAASDNDTVFVHRGRYFEKVIVNKSIRLVGADKKLTIIDANNKYDSIKICSNFVEIQGFTIQNAFINFNDIMPLCGIVFSLDINNISIHDNIIKNNCFGINQGSDYVKIYNNVFKNNIFGLITGRMHFNEVYNNAFINCGIFIDVEMYEDNYFDNNIVNGKPWICLMNKKNMTIENAGQVRLSHCSNITIKNLDIQIFDCCLSLENCDNCSIIGNKIGNSIFGIALDHCENIQIKNNDFSFVINGIWSERTEKNLIINNNIFSWTFIGLHIYSSLLYQNHYNFSDNLIKNAFLIGIYLSGVKNCTISNNMITASKIFRFLSDYFVYPDIVYYNMRGGLPDENPYGIFLIDRSQDNIIIHNTISRQNRSLLLASSNNQVLENNFLSNTVDAFFYDCHNIWNGNYWNEPMSGPKAIEGYSGDELVYEYDYNPAQEPWGNIGGLNKYLSIFNIPFKELLNLWNVFRCCFTFSGPIKKSVLNSLR